MKKLLCLGLVLSLALSLCACGEPQVITETVETVKEVVPEKYTKYEDLIDALEAEDYDGAAALIDAMRPEPEIVEIEITMDNFFDYFEPCEYANYDSAPRDAQGNITYLSVYKGYALKPEFTPAGGVDANGSVKAGLEWTESDYFANLHGGLEIDFDTLAFNNSVPPDFVSQESELVSCRWTGKAYAATVSGFYYSDPINGPSGSDQIALISDLTVVSASGTLYLAK